MNEPAWKPPENPDPRAINRRAAIDSREGRYAEALAKHLWYFHHALEIDSDLSGVRLSFALGEWMRLALDYPPAKEAFLRTRDEAEAEFQRSHDSQSFQDLAALNRELNATERTVELLVDFAAADVEGARKLYRTAERYLVKQGHYLECGPFLETTERMQKAQEAFHRLRAQQKEFMESRQNVSPMVLAAMQEHDAAAELYRYGVGALVGLLIHNNRREDAQQVCETATQVLDDELFRKILDAALRGTLPKDPTQL